MTSDIVVLVGLVGCVVVRDVVRRVGLSVRGGDGGGLVYLLTHAK